MHASARSALLFVSLAGLLLGAAPASAADCTYTDLLGTFSLSADCEGLADHTGLGNEQKRIWLGGTWGELNILEVPEPYKQDPAMVQHVMDNLGRKYTERRAPEGVQSTMVGGQEALVVLEHKMRASSRSWVLHWQGRNLIVRAVAYGKRPERMARLEQITAVVGSFAAATPVELGAEARPRVRERKDAPTVEAAPVEAAPVEAAPVEAAAAPTDAPAPE